jgi:NADH-quinone oxidoreductase subunit G
LNHPQAAQILASANRIAAATNATVSVLPEGANSVGAHWVGAVAKNGSLTAQQMLAQPRAAYVLLNTEPQFDAGNPVQAVKSLNSAFVVAINAYASAVADYADVILPATPFTETAGTFINAEGRAQGFHPVVKPLAQARPAWKILRVLGERFGFAGFTANDVADVRTALSGVIDNGATLCSNAVLNVTDTSFVSTGLEKSARVAPYAGDAVTRRAESLQKTGWAQDSAVVGLAKNVYESLGLAVDLAGDAEWVYVAQDGVRVKAQAVLRESLADNVVDIQAGSALAAQLGSQFGSVTVERS